MNLAELKKIGVSVSATDQYRLRLEAENGLLTPSLLSEIAKHKASLLNELAENDENVNLVNIVNFVFYGQGRNKGQLPPIFNVHLSGSDLIAKTYYAHHFNCGMCIAAGRGKGYARRCKTGQDLWFNYVLKLIQQSKASI